MSVGFTNDTKHESQLSRRLRRSVVSEDENEKCYRQFFVGKQPPIGFESSTGKANNIRYICQGDCQWTSCFSTMFDLNYGIPIYSAYVVKADQVPLFGTARRSGMNFRREPGKPLLLLVNYLTAGSRVQVQISHGSCTLGVAIAMHFYSSLHFDFYFVLNQTSS